MPQMQIRANRERLAWYGIPVSHFTRFVEMAFSGGEDGRDI
jgi:Cu/Ag efflux pump CusA